MRLVCEEYDKDKNDFVVCTFKHWNCIFVAFTMYANKIRMNTKLILIFKVALVRREISLTHVKVNCEESNFQIRDKL